MPEPEYLGDEASQAPLVPGTMRVLWCRICFALIGIKTAEGMSGEPESHELWHVQRGDRVV
jgi:hypothetical protein